MPAVSFGAPSDTDAQPARTDTHTGRNDPTGIDVQPLPGFGKRVMPLKKRATNLLTQTLIAINVLKRQEQRHDVSVR
ncbi:MAG: hypothetical protein AAF290_08940 [Pseudomonadota bacterium]